MKKLALVLILVAAVTSCGIATQYNTKNYPDSIIIGAFERAGVNPEQFSIRVARAVQAEIAMGKFNRDETLDFLGLWQAKVAAGIKYNAVADLIDEYTRKLFIPEGDNVSEAALLAYYLFMPDLPTLKIDAKIGDQDVEIINAFIKYISSRI